MRVDRHAPPTMQIRRAADRGHANYGWLDTHHTFSFAQYRDPEHMGFRSLRVINDDRVTAGSGFPTHPHRDMEILSYVVEGALEHRDSMGNGSVIRPGDIQRMSAGTGVTHSEYNPSSEAGTRFLQIWIIPEAQSLAPSYEQKHVGREERRGALRLLASRTGRDDSISLHQDLDLYGAILSPGDRVEHHPAPTRHLWVQVVAGALELEGERLEEGDGMALSHVDHLRLRALEDSDVLVFDLA